MVEREIVVTRSTQAQVETLPPLPVLAGLDRDRWEVLEVPADDPDAIFAALLPRLRALARDHAGTRIVGDFTGGTKSMSAGLTLAAIEAGLALQLVTGERDDLVRVRDLTQVPVALETRRIAVERTRRILAEGWGRFAYQETAEGFSQLRSELKEEGWGRSELSPLTRAWELSKAFAAWDRFDHKPAASDLRKYRAVVIGGRTDWHSLALTLAERPQDRWTALALADLWANAQRCAARGRYDDAIGRWYRLCEGIAQWLLWADFKIATASVPVERLPDDIRAGVEIDNGAAKLGLRRAWELYMRLRPESELAAFAQKPAGDGKNEFDRLNDNLQRRNRVFPGPWLQAGQRGRLEQGRRLDRGRAPRVWPPRPSGSARRTSCRNCRSCCPHSDWPARLTIPQACRRRPCRGARLYAPSCSATSTSSPTTSPTRGGSPAR